MAKRLRGRYLPGRRGDSWLKIKCRKSLLCAIIGFVPDGDDIKSLIVAAPEGGNLRCVGRVGSGITERERTRLLSLFADRLRDEPIVPSHHEGRWIEPGLYGLVEYQEITRGGDLRAPAWKGLVDEEGRPAR